MAEKGGDASKRVAQNGAADVTDVHRFRHIRRSEIDHDFFGQSCPGNAESFIIEQLGRLFRDRVSAQSEIDEAGASNSGLFRQFANIDMFQNFRRDFSWIFAELLPEHERGVGLVIAETRIRGRSQFANVFKTGDGKRLG